ncbi:MAG: hypothetical protein JXA22_04945 [Candidatus Thermoplasmatota archaeon]|nr:hypothetical protein [Candidatus Thermoplasmatota archaeon]
MNEIDPTDIKAVIYYIKDIMKRIEKDRYAHFPVLIMTRPSSYINQSDPISGYSMENDLYGNRNDHLRRRSISILFYPPDSI